MLKLFISQPMKDKTKKEIQVERAHAIKTAKVLLGQEFTVIDSFIDEDTPKNPVWYLGKSLQMMALADVAYFATGWENSRGCKIEYECAKQYGIIILNNV